MKVKLGFNKSIINLPGVVFCKVKMGVYSKSRVIVPISKIFLVFIKIQIFETSTVLNNPEPYKHNFLIFSALVIALVWLNNWLSVVCDSSFVCYGKLAIDCIYACMTISLYVTGSEKTAHFAHIMIFQYKCF